MTLVDNAPGYTKELRWNRYLAGWVIDVYDGDDLVIDGRWLQSGRTVIGYGMTAVYSGDTITIEAGCG